MRKLIILSALCAVLGGGFSTASADALRNKNARNSVDEDAHAKKRCRKIITEEEINEASSNPNGLVLTKPGVYKLCGTVHWKNTANNHSAITIAGENITLILKNFTMIQEHPSASGCNGIQIAGTAKYVTVRNGTLKQFSGTGVLVQSGAYAFVIDRINCDTCGYSGPLQNSGIGTLGGMGIFWNAGIYVNGGVPGGDFTPTISNGIIKKCEVSHSGIYGVMPVSFTGSISGNILTLQSPPVMPIHNGFNLTGTGIPSGTTIVNGPTAGTFANSGQTLPLGATPLNVTSTNGFPTQGTIIVLTSTGPHPVTYNGLTPTSFLNTSGGTGSTTIGFAVPSTVTGVTYQISTSLGSPIGPEPMKVSDPNAIFTVPVGTDFVHNGNNSGILISSASNIEVSNCVVNDTFGIIYSYGINHLNCRDIYTKGCTVQNTKSYFLAKGLFCIDNEAVVYEDTHVLGVTGYVAPAVFVPHAGTNGAEGIKTSSNDVVMSRCSFQDLAAVTQTPFDSSTLPTPGYVCESFGIISLAQTNGLFQDVNIQGIRNDGGGFATNPTATNGVFEAVNTQNNHFVNCSVTDVTTSQGPAIGFGDLPPVFIGPAVEPTIRNNTFIGCTAENINITGVSNTNQYAAGFVLGTSINRVEGCSANLVQNLTGSGTSAGYGILLGTVSPPPSEATRCVIANNILTNCSTAGLFDQTTAKNSAITGNYAAFNGVAPYPAGNYSGVNPISVLPTIQDWSTTGAPTAVPAVGSAAANISLHN